MMSLYRYRLLVTAMVFAVITRADGSPTNDRLCAGEPEQEMFKYSCDLLIGSLYELMLPGLKHGAAAKMSGLEFARNPSLHSQFFPFSPFNKDASEGERQARITVCKRLVAHPGVRRRCCTLIRVLCPEATGVNGGRMHLPAHAFLAGMETEVRVIPLEKCGRPRTQKTYELTCDYLTGAIYDLETTDMAQINSFHRRPAVSGLNFSLSLLTKQFAPDRIPYFPFSPCNPAEKRNEVVARRRMCATMTNLSGSARRCCTLLMVLCAHEKRIAPEPTTITSPLPIVIHTPPPRPSPQTTPPGLEIVEQRTTIVPPQPLPTQQQLLPLVPKFPPTGGLLEFLRGFFPPAPTTSGGSGGITDILGGLIPKQPPPTTLVGGAGDSGGGIGGFIRNFLGGIGLNSPMDSPDYADSMHLCDMRPPS